MFCSKEDIKEYVTTRKTAIKQELQGKLHVPTLAIVQVGDNPASNKYIGGKIKDCEEVGIKAILFKFDEDIKVGHFMDRIIDIAKSKLIHGIIIQKPLPQHIEECFASIVDYIPAHKDVDGFKKDTIFDPCTPKGIIDYIEDRMGVDWLRSKEVVIINRTELVGRPLARMMLDRDATVTVCHSHTRNLAYITSMADIVVSAIGKPKKLNSEYVYPGGVCIDVGISFDENGKMCGDFDREDVLKCTDYCTPVPGGVGLLTRLALLENVLKAYQLAEDND